MQLLTGSPWPVRRLVTAETATTGKAYHRRIGPAAASQVPAGSPSCSPLKTLQAQAGLSHRALQMVIQQCKVRLALSCRMLLTLR